MGVLVLGAALASACSATDSARPASAEDRGGLTELLTSMNERCSGFERALASPASPDDELFVELAILDVPTPVAEQASLSTLRELSRSERVALLSAPHALGKWDQAVEMAPGAGSASPPGTSLTGWSIRPRRAEDVAVLELQIRLTSAGGATRDVAFTATARHNEPTLAHVVWDHASRRSLLLLLRVFEVHGEPDRRAIFECKMREHQRARRQHAVESEGE